MTSPTSESSSLRLWRTAVALSLLQLALHVVAGLGARDSRVLLPHAVAWLHDLALLCAVAAIFAGLTRVSGVALRGIVELGGRCALVATGMVLAIYPQMLQAFLAAPANFLEADAETASVFVQDYFGIRALWPAAIALGAGVVAPRASFLRIGNRWALAGISLAVLAVFALGRDSPNPVVFGLQDTARQLFVPRVVPRIKVKAATTSAPMCSTSIDWSPAAGTTRYEHVMLIVLEGVTSTEFEAGFLARAGGFFGRYRSHARYFSRFYATNLDSYTSLVAMTMSIQVPFRAYAAPEQYVSVNNGPNIARGLRAAGFRTLFISTYEHQPFVPNPQDWDKLLDRRDLGDLSAWVSLGSNRMESATEDRAALPTILEFMKSAPRSLVMAELVFGHSPEWRARTGMTPVEYYDRYLIDLWDRLTQAQLAARTLVVVVSDHGERSRAAVPDNYRVPLLIVGETVEPGEDNDFRSHLDLQPIVAHFFLGAEMPLPRQTVVVVGSTERWVYGEIRGNGKHVFIDDGSGSVLAGALDAVAVHDSFQAYVASFSGAFVSAMR
jgi:hypothetical protein